MKASALALSILVLAAAAGAGGASAQTAEADAAFQAALKDISAGVPAGTLKLRGLAERDRAARAQAAADESEEAYTVTAGGDAALKPAYTIVRKGEAYFIYGNGSASDGGGSVNWRDFQAGVKETVSGSFSVGLVHHNEGHPIGVGHRDGFAALAWYDRDLSDRVRAEAGAGPYFSMNTVTVDGRQLDQKKFGLLSALAVVYRLNDSGLGLRAQYNYVKMPGSFDTKTVMIGVNQELDGKSWTEGAPADGAQTSVGLWGGSMITNRGGQQGHLGYQAEVERAVNGSFAYSASVIDEGNSTLTNRAGAAAQVWYVAPAAGRLTVSAGAGPYVADERDAPNRGMKLLGVISLKVEMAVTRKTKCGVRMNRVVSSYNMDEDMFMAGCERSIDN